MLELLPEELKFHIAKFLSVYDRLKVFGLLNKHYHTISLFDGHWREKIHDDYTSRKDLPAPFTTWLQFYKHCHINLCDLSPETKFFTAAQQGWDVLLEKISHEHSFLRGNFLDSHKRNALDCFTFVFRRYNHSLEIATNIVRILIEMGVDVNSSSPVYGRQTPLHLICHFGFANGNKSRAALRVAQALVEHGADVNIKDTKGRNPFHILCCHGFKDEKSLEDVKSMFLSLLEAGVDIKSQDRDGNSPLHLLCHYGLQKKASGELALFMLETLLERGVQVNTVTNEGWTPLHHACRFGFSSGAAPITEKIIVKFLDHGSDVNAQTPGNWTPFQTLCRYGFLVDEGAHARSIMMKFIAEGYNYHTSASKGWSTLHLLCRYGFRKKASVEAAKKLVIFFLEHDFNVNQRVQGWTSLNILCRYGFRYRGSCKASLEIVKLFLARGADPNCADYKGWSPLSSLCKYGFRGKGRVAVQAVKELMEHGADVFCRGRFNRTLLHLVTRYVIRQDKESGLVLTRLFLRHRVNSNLKDDKQATALTYACRFGFLCEDFSHTKQLILSLLNAGVDVDVEDKDEWSPLQYVCNKGFRNGSCYDARDIVHALLEQGNTYAQIRGRNIFPLRTALHAICHRGFQFKEAAEVSKDIVKTLLERGVQVNTPMRGKGWTALHLLCRFAFQKNTTAASSDAALMMLNQKASVQRPTLKKGWTVLHLLCCWAFQHDTDQRPIKDVAVRMLELGATVTATDSRGRTPLQLLCSHAFELEGAAKELALILARCEEAEREGSSREKALGLRKYKTR